MDSALNNLHGLICRKTKLNQTKPKLNSLVSSFAIKHK